MYAMKPSRIFIAALAALWVCSACIGAESLPPMCDERLMRGADAAAWLTTKLGRTRQEDIGSSSRLRSKLMTFKEPGILVE